MINIRVQNETGELKLVVLGIAHDFGGKPEIDECYDPKSRKHVFSGTYPQEKDLIKEIECLITIFNKHNVEVLRPLNILGLNQIFSRDIAFVIENKIIVPNIIANRKQEQDALKSILEHIPDSSIVRMPASINAEGGDIILNNDLVFVGYSSEDDFQKYLAARTNKLTVDFLQKIFPHKIVRGLELNKSDEDPRENILHLDCCFQPVGKDMAILYKQGFKNKTDVNFIINYFGSENIIELDQNEMCDMYSNIFSSSKEVVISDPKFVRLNRKLKDKGFIVEESNYAEVSKMGGLFRCSTMPLIREK